MNNSNLLKNDLLIRALLRQPTEMTPVWLMRQAGRYLPEYRALRAKAGSFMTLCQTPELACEVTLQPLRRFALDAAILFSDILTIPDAMGLGLYFTEGEGPRFKNPLQNEQHILQLPLPDPEQELRYVMDTVRLIKKELENNLPLIGFAGSPWTLASYMVEGSASKNFLNIRRMIYQNPQLLHTLLNTLTKSITDYLNAQIQAGVNAVMIFDSWGGLLNNENYQQFSLAYMQQIMSGLARHYNNQIIPVIIFTKGGGQWLEKMAASGCDAIGIDWMTNLGYAKQQVKDKVALQGNIDPAALCGTPENLTQQIAKTLADFGSGNGHVFNLGHGIEKETPVENVQLLVETVHKLSQRKK